MLPKRTLSQLRFSFGFLTLPVFWVPVHLIHTDLYLSSPILVVFRNLHFSFLSTFSTFHSC